MQGLAFWFTTTTAFHRVFDSVSNMASSAQLAIAKASLLAALLKPDPEADLPACSRDEIEQFHGLFSAAVARCSPANVQVWNT